MGGDKPLDDSIEKDTFATDFAAYPELAWAGDKFKMEEGIPVEGFIDFVRGEIFKLETDEKAIGEQSPATRKSIRDQITQRNKELDLLMESSKRYPEIHDVRGQKFETRKQLEAYWTHIDPLRERFSPYYKGAGETDQQGDWRQAEVALWNRRELKIPKKAETIVPPITPEPGVTATPEPEMTRIDTTRPESGRIWKVIRRIAPILPIPWLVANCIHSSPQYPPSDAPFVPMPENYIGGAPAASATPPVNLDYLPPLMGGGSGSSSEWDGSGQQPSVLVPGATQDSVSLPPDRPPAQPVVTPGKDAGDITGGYKPPPLDNNNGQGGFDGGRNAPGVI